MKKKLFGNKDSFAIEYLVDSYSPYLMGKICIWIGNQSVGYWDESVMLEGSQHSIRNFMDRLDNIENTEFSKMDACNVYGEIFSEEGCDAKYVLSPGESFDDFAICAYREGFTVHFIWKLSDNPFFEYQGISSEIQHEAIEVGPLKSALEPFVESLDFEKSRKP